jgi:hypothetical protein
MKAHYSALAVRVFTIIPLLFLLFSATTVLGQTQCVTRHWIPMLTTPAPAGRQKGAMAYDVKRGQTVLFGGNDVITDFGTNRTYGDTWEFDGGAWQRHFPAHYPSPRAGHTLTYDAGRGVTVLFGGRGSDGYSNEIWEWDGNDWSQVTVSGASPEGRTFHGMAYDSTRGVHVMYGGFRPTGVLGDTWEYDGAARTWTSRTPPDPGPGPRFWFQLAFDAARNQTLLFGGAQSDTIQLGDTWIWDGQAGVWTQRSPPVQPSARQLYTLTYDNFRELVLLQCGSRVDHGSTLVDGESWEWDGSTWHDLTPNYFLCCPRSGEGMTYDSRLQQMVLFGGAGARDDDGTVWVLRTAWNGPSWFVDWRNSGSKDGSAAHPYQTLHQASAAASDCTLLSIEAGDYLEGTLTLNKSMRLETHDGPVRIH